MYVHMQLQILNSCSSPITNFVITRINIAHKLNNNTKKLKVTQIMQESQANKTINNTHSHVNSI